MTHSCMVQCNISMVVISTYINSLTLFSSLQLFSTIASTQALHSTHTSPSPSHQMKNEQMRTKWLPRNLHQPFRRIWTLLWNMPSIRNLRLAHSHGIESFLVGIFHKDLRISKSIFPSLSFL